MNTRNHKIALLLGYAGLLPFVGLALAAWLEFEQFAPLLSQALLIYGAVILSFLGGVIWGRLLAPDASAIPGRTRHFIYSVLPSLLGWSAIFIPLRVGLFLLAAGFVATWAYDRMLLQSELLPAWYLHMRIHLTTVAVLSLLVAALAPS